LKNAGRRGIDRARGDCTAADHWEVLENAMITRRDAIGGSGALWLASIVPALEADAADAPLDLSPTFEAIRRHLELPAMGAIVVTGDRIIGRGVCGVRRMGEPGAVAADPHWQLGSITKTFTATLAAMLIERGKLTFDTTLRQVYPEHAKIMAPGVGDITVRQLITHRSGMGHDAFGWEGAPETNGPGLTLSQRRQRGVVLSLKAPLEFTPAAKYSYSNRGYNTLGPVLEKVAGRAYEDMIVQDIAKPLGIPTVVFGEPALADPNREPWPHIPQGERWKPVAPVPLTAYGYHIFNTAGGISLTLGGFARWMQAHLNGEVSGGLVSADMFKTLHTPLERGGVPGFFLSGIGIPGRTINHGGTNGRNAADHWMFLERGVGILMTTNALPPANIPYVFMSTNTLIATALPGARPLPAISPPAPDANGTIEGEALEFVRASGGHIDFQGFKNLSGGFQLTWSGAKDGDKLVLRLRAPARARYAVEGVFARNADYGTVMIGLGAIQKQVQFRADRLAWETIPLGETMLDAGPHELTITAQGNAGSDGTRYHLGVDLLRVKPV
jgi:CubicO group peptidase (beta-lactamase class C family)